MPATYSIIIQNQSGSHENYSIYAAVPEVSGVFDAAVTPAVIYSVLVPQGGRCEVEFSPEYAAIWGTYSAAPKPGVETSVGDSQSINLVALGPDGEISSQGSKLVLEFKEQQPRFESPITTEDGQAGTFKLATSTFQGSEAKDDGLFVGVATSSDIGLGILGSWTPQPNVEYEVKPLLQFRVVAGSRLETGSIVNPEKFKDRACPVDFSQHSRNEVNLVHDSSGRLATRID